MSAVLTKVYELPAKLHKRTQARQTRSEQPARPVRFGLVTLSHYPQIG